MAPFTLSRDEDSTVAVVIEGHLDRFQLEAGTFRTSHIETTTAVVSRAADTIEVAADYARASTDE